MILDVNKIQEGECLAWVSSPVHSSNKSNTSAFESGGLYQVKIKIGRLIQYVSLTQYR